MALSEKKHHASRGQRRRTGPGRWVRDVLHGQVPGQPTTQPELFQLFEEESGGSRPPCLGEPPGPQERIQPHIMEHLAYVVPMVQGLDFPVAQEGGAQEGDQLVAVLKAFDFPVPVQVIRVPKLSFRRGWRSSWWRC